MRQRLVLLGVLVVAISGLGARLCIIAAENLGDNDLAAIVGSCPCWQSPGACPTGYQACVGLEWGQQCWKCEKNKVGWWCIGEPPKDCVPYDQFECGKKLLGICNFIQGVGLVCNMLVQTQTNCGYVNTKCDPQ